MYIRNTAATITFVLRDATDGSLVTTGTCTSYISKDGGAQAATTNSATHLGNGQWALTLTLTEMNAERVDVLITESGSVPVERNLVTEPDLAAIKTKTDFLPSATAGAAGGVLIAGSNAATTFATLTSTGAFSINGNPMTAQSGDCYARLGLPTGASVSADIAASRTVINNIDTDVTDLVDNRITAARAGYLNKLNIASSEVAGATELATVDTVVDTISSNLDTRLTGTRAGYLDKLAITGNVAAAGDLTAVDTVVDTILTRTPDNKPTVSVGGKMQSNVMEINSLTTLDGMTPAETLALILAVSVGKISGSSTNTPIIRSADDTVDRVTATVNEYGDRLSITTNLTSI